MQRYPYHHTPVKVRKLRALFEYQPHISGGHGAWVCTTLNELNGEDDDDGGFVRPRDGTCVVPTESVKVWDRLRDGVEGVKRRGGRRLLPGRSHHGGVFMLDPWGNVAVPRSEEIENDQIEVEWYQNGKFGDFLWFDMPYGMACHDGLGKYQVGDPWHGPADGLAFIITESGRIMLSGDRGLNAHTASSL